MTVVRNTIMEGHNDHGDREGGMGAAVARNVFCETFNYLRAFYFVLMEFIHGFARWSPAG
jgi:hypothetical protein